MGIYHPERLRQLQLRNDLSCKPSLMLNKLNKITSDGIALLLPYTYFFFDMSIQTSY